MYEQGLLRQVGFSETRVSQLLPLIELRQFESGEYFGQGVLAPLTCILSGLVGAGQVSRTNGEFTLANIHSQGTWLGGEEMFNRMPTGQDYLCLAPTRLLIIPQQAALEAFEKEAEFSRYIARQQAWRKHWQADMRYLLTAADPAARVVFGLAMLAEALHCSYSHLAVDLPDSPLAIPVKQTLLANLCCVSRGVFSSTAQQLADAGVARVVMGSAAVRDPQLVDAVAQIVDVAVGLDHRNGEVATDGWLRGSTLTLSTAVTQYPAAAAFVITDISRDGMLAGPDVEGLRHIATLSSTPIIASGGVAALTDLRQLRDVRSLAGVIVGKALYEGRFTTREALKALQA